MIYLIGGPPKCGKTTLAKAISLATNVPWISADTLQNIVWAYTSEEKLTELFPRKMLRGESTDEEYAKHSLQTIIDCYIKQGQTSYDAIAMMAETYLTDGDACIVEGYQVTPEVVHQIHQQYGREKVQTVFLVREDAEQFVADIHRSTTPNDWIIRRTNDESTYPKIAQMVTEYSKYFSEEAAAYDLPLVKMDQDFDEKIDVLVEEATTFFDKKT